MKTLYTIGEAAEKVGVTSETLRHYDRINLVKPSVTDKQTSYRYYTTNDIVLLRTAYALRMLELPLSLIKEVMNYDNLDKVIEFMAEAEKKANEKVSTFKDIKKRIQRAKQSYIHEREIQTTAPEEMIITFPERVILLSESEKKPTLTTLWSYLSNFDNQLSEEEKKLYEFENLAGIYTENGISRLFALCLKYGESENLRVLPAGKYLCLDVSENEREEKKKELLQKVSNPSFIIEQVIVSGIVKWNYQIQIPLEEQGVIF